MMHHFLSIYWNFDPALFTLGSYSFRYYNILFVLGFVVGYFMGKGMLKREHLPVSLLDSIVYTVFFSAAIGARLGHCFFYDPLHYLSHPIEILKMWEGGLASHGGVIGVLIGLWFFVIKKYKPKYGFDYIWLLDRVSIPAAITCCFIRLGNLMNSEIYGTETSLPWGFIFARNGETLPKHPTQIYEALSYLLIFFILVWLYRKYLPKLKKGMLMSITLILGFTARFLIEFIKNPQVAFEHGMILDMGQWLSIPFILFGIGFLIYSYKKGKPAMLPQKGVEGVSHTPVQGGKKGAVGVGSTPIQGGKKDGNRLGKKRRQ